jgi:DNA polymerase-3 subunit gamma/tau
MSYVVFALKWRPKNFEDIVGQAHIVNTLKSALEKDRLAHAYLFAGPRGVGKTSTARILAKALNCQKGPTTNPCGACPACLEITQGNSLDVIEIDGASNTGVEEIRNLRESVKFSPASAKFKIYIIDEVHMLSQGAFNALLKTLEEPPPFVKFIFATTHPEKIPSTVISRCQRLDFRRISLMEIIAQLEKISRAEHIDVDKEVLFAISKSSDGSLRDAESILDQLVSFSRGKVSLQDISSVFGLISQDALFEMTEKIIRKDSQGALALLNDIIEEGKDIGIFLANLTEHFRNLMIAKVTQANPDLIDLPKDICDRLSQQTKELALDEIFSAFNVLVNTKEMSKRLESIRIPLEIALVKLTQDKKSSSANHPVAKHSAQITPEPTVKEEPVKKESEIKQADPPTKVEAYPQQNISIEEVKQSWQGIIENLTKVKMSLATYLNEGTPLKLENNILTIAFPKDYSLHKESLESKENRALLEKAFSELLHNVRLRIHLILTQDAALPTDEPENPLLKTALKMFGGRVIKEG